MRSYPSNSPQAVARLVALAALADGHFSRSELGALEQPELTARLGMSRQQLHDIVRHLSEDLMATVYPQWGTACQMDASVLHSLLAEVTDPALRRKTLELCVAVANSDRHIADAEENLIVAAAQLWFTGSAPRAAAASH